MEGEEDPPAEVSPNVGKLPAVVIEQMQPDYSPPAGSDGNTGDHLCASCIDEVTFFNVLFFSRACQVYMTHNLDVFPHGTVARVMLPELIERATDYRIPITYYEPDKSYLDPNECVQVVNEGSEGWDVIKHAFPGRGTYIDAYNRLKATETPKDKLRGSVQESHAFSMNHNIAPRDPETGVSWPRMRPHTDAVKYQFQCHSELATLRGDLCNTAESPFRDLERNKAFLGTVCEGNLGEGLTTVVNNKGSQLVLHVDVGNCSTPSHKYVLTSSYCFESPTEPGEYVRCANIMYSRASCHHAMERVRVHQPLVDHISKWRRDHCTAIRACTVPEFIQNYKQDFRSSKSHEGVYIGLPRLDRQSYISPFTVKIKQLMDVYRLMLFKVFELLLIVGIVNSAVNFVRVADKWLDKELPEGNLFVEFIKDNVEYSGSLNGKTGDAGRARPSFNKNIHPGTVVYSCNTLLQAWICSLEERAHTDGVVSKAAYRRLLQSIKRVKGVSDYHETLSSSFLLSSS